MKALSQVLLAAARRGQGGALGFDRDAQLQHRDDVLQRAELVGRDPERGRVAQANHEGADAVPRLDQAGGLQPGDRLPHHGAADPELLHDGRLGRQLLALRQRAVADAAGKRVHHVVGEAAGATADDFTHWGKPSPAGQGSQRYLYDNR